MRLFVLVLALTVALPLVSADHTGDIMFDPAAGLAPTPSEVMSAVDAIRDHAWATVYEVGASVDATPIFAVALTNPESEVPRNERVVTFIMTQQHGNEPAGTPAALQLLQEVHDGTGISALLDNQILIVMPQSNPDGALDSRRTNEDGEDINRDHIDVGTPESKAIHKVLTTWDVHMAYDHHEYGGTGIGYPVPVHSYDFDVTTMWPNHGNVRDPTRDLALEINYEHVVPALEAKGFSHGDYGVQTVSAGPVSQPVATTAGGPDPGILRNSYGLNNIAGLLVESYIPTNGDQNIFQTFERRVESHYIVMESVLTFGHENAGRIIETKRASEELNRNSPMSEYLEGDLVGPMPKFFRATGAHADSFVAHQFPMPVEDGSGFVSATAQARGGLLAALLHGVSSRSVESAEHLDAATLDAGYYSHPDFAGPALVTETAAEDAEAPNVALVVLMAAFVVLASWRRN
jgi:hypothetical protein